MKILDPLRISLPVSEQSVHSFVSESTHRTKEDSLVDPVLDRPLSLEWYFRDLFERDFVTFQISPNGSLHHVRKALADNGSNGSARESFKDRI